MITVKEFIKADDALAAEIHKLERISRKHDGHAAHLQLDPSLNYDDTMKSVFVLYEEDKLVSAATLFAPTPGEAELSALTLPKFRQQGYFNLLYFRARDEAKRCGAGRLLLTCDRDSDTGFESVSAHGAKLDHSEYRLLFSAEDRSFLDKTADGLTITQCASADARKLASLYTKIFGEKRADAEKFMRRALKEPGRRQFLAQLDGEAVGMGAIESDGGDACIYCFGIPPAHRRKGLGRALLYMLIKTALNDGNGSLHIEVDSENDAALSLYKSSGFTEKDVCDYYVKEI